ATLRLPPHPGRRGGAVAPRHTAVIISPEGVIQVLHSDLPVDVRSHLEAHAYGNYVTLTFHTTDPVTTGLVSFLQDPVGQTNPRARDALASLTGVHVALTGTVAFTGLTPEHLVRIVDQVG